MHLLPVELPYSCWKLDPNWKGFIWEVSLCIWILLLDATIPEQCLELLCLPSVVPQGLKTLQTSIDPRPSRLLLNQRAAADVCKSARSLLWSPTFNLHCAFTPAPLSKIRVLLLPFWMAPSPPGLHSLIDCRRLWWSSGPGLVFSIYNAPALQKRPQ